MGAVRILLAICVFCAHSRPLGNFNWLSGGVAVESFFVISGFYMQLILNTRYTKQKMGSSWIYQFYRARYLRLFPIYLGGSLIVICAVLLRPSMDPLPIWIYLYTIPNSLGNLLFKIFFCFTNVTMFFQELIMFFSTHKEQIYWSSYLNSEIPLWRGLLIPQAWTFRDRAKFLPHRPVST